MIDPVRDAARSAVILASDFGPNLDAEVEVALYARHKGEQRPGQYDPLAIASLGTSAASLIVTIAQLAWSIVSDQRKHAAEPSPGSIARQVRSSLREQDTPMPAETDRIAEVVVDEIIRLEDPPQ